MSLAELIASGDEDAISGFRDAHVDKVQAYCTVTCGPETAADACEAAFVDFLGRALTTPESERQLEELLLKATRSAAAARFRVPDAAPPPTRPELCAATPELLAARANRELPTDDHGLSAHLKHCARCRASAAQIERADAAFGAALGWAELVAPEEPVLSVVRARRGGLVGAAKRLGRQLGGGPER
jgi:DNA-directed RNA polymerase specialized sigma24 family protein